MRGRFRLLAAIVAPLVLSGCGAGPAAERAGATGMVLPPLVLAMPDRGARQYNEPGPPPRPGPPADVVARLVAATAAALGRDVPVRDGRLDAVCTALARVLTDERPTPFELVEFALQHHGVVEPAPRLILATVGPQGGAAFMATLARRLPRVLAAGRYRRVGVGGVLRPDGARLVIALQESFLRTEPFAREVAHNALVQLRGQLGPTFERPHLYMSHPGGAVEELELAAERGGRFAVSFRCRGAGQHRVELVADDRFGTTVIANFPLYCGISAPLRAAAPLGADTPVTDARVAERRLMELTNETRRAHGLPPLDWSPELAQVARAHGADMAEHGFVGHVSPTQGDTAARLKRARLRVGRLRENVARAFSAEEAHRGLLASPAHRGNLLARDVTRAGIGVALGGATAGRREIFVTELLFSVARDVAPHENVYIAPP
ncbi:MAG TPA: CAP domain-containing protein [Polyangia bacterium]|jgi:uncharacterized protein YkwD